MGKMKKSWEKSAAFPLATHNTVMEQSYYYIQENATWLIECA